MTYICEGVIRHVSYNKKLQEGHKLDPHLKEKFSNGWLMVVIASCLGKCGCVDGDVSSLILSVRPFRQRI